MAWLDDVLDPGGLTDRSTYRIASGALLIVMVTAAIISDDRWYVGLANLLLYLALLFLTLRRLRDAGRSLNWIVFMVFVPQVGPAWHVVPNWVLQPTDVLPLIPVAIGWWARGAISADGGAESA